MGAMVFEIAGGLADPLSLVEAVSIKRLGKGRVSYSDSFNSHKYDKTHLHLFQDKISNLRSLRMAGIFERNFSLPPAHLEMLK